MATIFSAQTRQHLRRGRRKRPPPGPRSPSGRGGRGDEDEWGPCEDVCGAWGVCDGDDVCGVEAVEVSFLSSILISPWFFQLILKYGRARRPGFYLSLKLKRECLPRWRRRRQVRSPLLPRRASCLPRPCPGSG